MYWTVCGSKQLFWGSFSVLVNNILYTLHSWEVSMFVSQLKFALNWWEKMCLCLYIVGGKKRTGREAKTQSWILFLPMFESPFYPDSIFIWTVTTYSIFFCKPGNVSLYGFNSWKHKEKNALNELQFFTWLTYMLFSVIESRGNRFKC